MALFPLVILLYAWWKRDRVVWKDVATALPFFAVSIVLGLTTIAAGNWFREAHLQPTAPPGIGSWPVHLALAGLSMTHYFSKVVWPFGLMPIYPLWKINPPMLIQFLPWPVWAGIVYWLWTQRTGWGRHALLGLGFFLINLLPFVGFTSVSYMAYTWVMDHFLYLPMIGLIGLAVAALDWTEYRISVAARPAFAGIVAAVFALLAWESHQYAGIFIGQEKLWTFTIEHNPKSWLAHNNLGNVLLETGRVPQAIAEYQQALRFDPHMVEANNNLGLALEQTGHPAEAIRHYQDALKYNPHFPLALINLGDALSQQGRIQEAIDPYTQALKINPNNADVRSNLGLVLIEAGRLPEAQEQFQAVLRLDPNSANARKNLARIDSMQKAAHPQP
jgi:tetratricopeptide (TPR) repeat protein